MTKTIRKTKQSIGLQQYNTFGTSCSVRI